MKRSQAETQESARKVSRRGAIVAGLQFGFAALLGLRMRHMQVDQADQYRLLAEENRINVRLIPPIRGAIFDRNGVVVAENEPSYRIMMVREDAGKEFTRVLEDVASLISMTPEAYERALNELQKARSAPFLPVIIADRVVWEDVAKINFNTPALPGVYPEVGLSRHYPLIQDFAHVVGYVGPVSERDLARLEDPDPVLRIPRFQIGKVGIETKYEQNLRGKAGAKRVEVNSVGRVMRELDRQEGVSGSNLRLTVDAQLQAYTRARLGEESASVVVMDCETGDVRAIASAPSFDPNKFVRGISFADYGVLQENERRPQASKTVQDAYPPGSTFKMVTALAALAAGVVGPEETVFCPGHMEVSGRKFHCWKRGGHGRMGLEKALRESCDVYFYDLAARVGIENIAKTARSLGLGEVHGVPMSAETSGIVPTKDWKEGKYQQSWVVGDTVNASIGQGFVLSSPLQLAVMTARLATGLSISPRLIMAIDGQEISNEEPQPLGFSKSHLRLIQNAMYSVSNHRRGTAYKSRVIADDKRIAGKTGTSQVRNISEAERARGVVRNEDLPWKRRDHALFVCYAPFDAPKFAVSVVVEHGGGGSIAAAPIARDIMLQALYAGVPPLNAYPKKDREKIADQQRALQKLMPNFRQKEKSRA